MTEKCFWYFAYGSNMDQWKLKAIGTFEPASAEPAYVKDKELVFDKYSNYWCGLAASIRECKGEKVRGVLYRVAGKDLETVYRSEGYAEGKRECQQKHYSKCKVEVFRENGEEESAITFVKAKKAKGNGGNPPKRYLDTLIAGAMQHKLPDCWIEYLKNLPTEDGKTSV